MRQALGGLVLLGVLSCASGQPHAWVQRGDSAAARKAWGEAARHYRKAVAQTPDAAVLLKLGRALYSQGDLRGSAEALQRALDADPRCGRCFSMLGLVAIDDQEYDRAMTLLRNALQLDPGDVGARNNLGFLQLMARQPDQAYETYLQSLAFDPNDPVANLNLARLCRDYLRDLQCARKHFRKVLEVQPGGSEAIEIRAWLQSQEDGSASRLRPTPQPDRPQQEVPTSSQARIEAPESAQFYADLAQEWEGKATKPLELELALKYAQKAVSLEATPDFKALESRIRAKLDSSRTTPTPADPP